MQAIHAVTRPLETPAKPDLKQQTVRRIAIGRRRAGADSDKINFLRVPSVPLDQGVLRQNRILTGHEPAAARESYQLLRTQVLHRLKENHWRTLAVTSPRAGAGSTLTAINLAMNLAREVAYTVVLVDANLRQPTLLDRLGLSERPGLSDYLSDVLPVESLMIRPYFMEDLIVLPGGTPVEGSAEMLNSPKMERLVADLKASADNCIVIFDMPPVLDTAETLAFSPQVDAALLVIEDGATTNADILSAVDMLGATNILGTVLNKANGA